MATRRDNAKSEEQIKQDVQAVVKGLLYERIESRIEFLGQCGFVLDVSLITSESTIRDDRFRKAASTALDEVVQEYKNAGWEVSREQNLGSEYGGEKLRFR